MISLDEIRRSLRSGDPSVLVGEFESEMLECKGQPYLLDTDRQKMELAKDVSALANVQGGVILMGFATTLDSIHGEERIELIRAFDKALLDPQRYRQVLADWLWPPIHDLEIQWYEAPTCPGKGVAAIFVPRADGLDRPVLIAKTILDGAKRAEIVFGYCERR
ncbi:MAG: helix-turn-helix domain-containing protein [Candidatus Binatia bacterium]